jgi:hypothetical protein
MATVKKLTKATPRTKSDLRKQARDGMRVKRAADRDIAVAPYRESPRRLASRESLLAFIRSYLPERFTLDMSEDQLAAIARMETAIKTGGQFAQACPRGDGKTERAIAACLWAWLCGWRPYVVIIGADLQQAKQILSEIHNELGDNDRIAEDWPEISACVRGMDGNANAARYQTINGEPARFVGGKNKIVYPQCDVAPGGLSGNVIEARGLTGSLRGMRHTPKNGTTLRPTLAIIDDPQTDESARSFDQVATRETLINGAIMGMAGPRKKIAAICNCTVIRRQDLADKLLDQKRHPEWRGVRFKMVYEWPARRDLWNQYMEMRRDGMRQGDGGVLAHGFYLDNREIMDAGSRVGWSARFREGEVSAIQCAYNIIADHGEDMFLAEYQNEPRDDRGGLWRLGPEQVMGNLNKLNRGQVPSDCTVLSVGLDVNIARGINWAVTSWTGETVGAVVDYGRFPAGDSPLWTDKSPYTEEQAIFAGIQSVLDDLLYNRQFLREGSNERVYPSCAGVDCGYKPETIFSAVKAARGKYGAVQVYPIRGVGGKNYTPRQAVSKGDSWHVAPYGTTRHNTLFFNVDVYRERVQRGFLLPAGCPGGSLALWGKLPEVHESFANQIASERIVDILHGDKLAVVYVWHLEPNRANDWLDASVYSVAGAARCGIRFGDVTPVGRTDRTAKIGEGPEVERLKPVPPGDPPPVRPNPLARPHSRPTRKAPGGFATRW